MQIGNAHILGLEDVDDPGLGFRVIWGVGAVVDLEIIDNCVNLCKYAHQSLGKVTVIKVNPLKLDFIIVSALIRPYRNDRTWLVKEAYIPED